MKAFSIDDVTMAEGCWLPSGERAQFIAGSVVALVPRLRTGYSLGSLRDEGSVSNVSQCISS